MIAIIDYNSGNIASLENALRRLEIPFVLTSDPDEILRAERVIFPGVGRAGAAMEELRKKNLLSVIPRIRAPFLGICLGLQLLFDSSEEDDVKCLGIISGEVKRFPRRRKLKVPHIGWNQVFADSPDNPLFAGIPDGSDFYFVNSYYAPLQKNTTAITKYGIGFSSAVQLRNFSGVQFHPEKSGDSGLSLLRNFCTMQADKRFEVIPAIDLLDDNTVVRLTKGKYESSVLYSNDPVGTARKFEREGASVIHVVDLEGARSGYPVASKTVLEIAHSVSVPVEAGGGIRTFEDAERYLKNGVERVILGSSAVNSPLLIKLLVQKYGANRILISLDMKKDSIVTHGWLSKSTLSMRNALDKIKTAGIRKVIFTNVEKDGMMQGPDMSGFQKILDSGFEVIVAGGISSASDVEKIEKSGASGCIIGKALYEGKLSLPHCVRKKIKNGVQKIRQRKTAGLRKRVIVCMDVAGEKVVKGRNYRDLNTIGDPVELAIQYEKDGADELVFLDITATNEKRKTILPLVRKIAESITIPFSVGGGIRTIGDIRDLLRAGADKVSIGSQAVYDPSLVQEAASTFGSQCIIISIDPIWNGNIWEITTKGGREKTGIDAIRFAKQMESLGAGELLVNSIDRDGTGSGYDLKLLKRISETVSVPVIASSGAGKLEHFCEAFRVGLADAVLSAGLFHSEKMRISDVKSFLKKSSFPIRL